MVQVSDWVIIFGFHLDSICSTLGSGCVFRVCMRVFVDAVTVPTTTCIYLIGSRDNRAIINARLGSRTQPSVPLPLIPPLFATVELVYAIYNFHFPLPQPTDPLAIPMVSSRKAITYIHSNSALERIFYCNMMELFLHESFIVNHTTLAPCNNNPSTVFFGLMGRRSGDEYGTK